jgi:HEAT repeat protein
MPIVEAAGTATLGETKNLEKLKSYLTSDEPAIRYWGATGLLILKNKARPAMQELIKALDDESANVAIVAAEAVYNLGEKEIAKEALLKALNNPNSFARCHALNTIDCIEEESPEIIEGVADMVKASPTMDRSRYDLRAAGWLFEKWEIDPFDYNLEFTW